MINGCKKNLQNKDLAWSVILGLNCNSKNIDFIGKISK